MKIEHKDETLDSYYTTKGGYVTMNIPVENIKKIVANSIRFKYDDKSDCVITGNLEINPNEGETKMGDKDYSTNGNWTINFDPIKFKDYAENKKENKSMKENYNLVLVTHNGNDKYVFNIPEYLNKYVHKDVTVVCETKLGLCVGKVISEPINGDGALDFAKINGAYEPIKNIVGVIPDNIVRGYQQREKDRIKESLMNEVNKIVGDEDRIPF